MMLLVPAPIEKRKAVSGAMRVICLGRFSMTFAATETIQSMPPAACIMAAEVTTARMIASAAAGGSPGGSRKTKTSTKVPRPPQRPTPTPPARVPMTIAPSTTSASSTKLTLMSFLPREMPGRSTGGALGGERLVQGRVRRAHVLERRRELRCGGGERLVAGGGQALAEGVEVRAQRGDGGVEPSFGHGLERVELGEGGIDLGGEGIDLRTVRFEGAHLLDSRREVLGVAAQVLRRRGGGATSEDERCRYGHGGCCPTQGPVSHGAHS